MPSTAVVITDSVNPAVKRPVANVPALVEECRLVRVWGGIHFRKTDEDSSALGHQIGDYAVKTWLRPASGAPAAVR